MSKDEFHEFFTLASVPESISSPTDILPLSTSSSKLSPKDLALKHAEKKVKNRDRMRKLRKTEKDKLNHLNTQVEALSRQLHHLLKMQGAESGNKIQTIQSIQNVQTVRSDTLSLPQDLRKQYLYRSYIQLLAMSEQLRKENEQHEQTLYKKWGRYVSFVNHQLNVYYCPPHPTVPPTTDFYTMHNFSCQPLPLNQIKSKPFTPNYSGKWVSFTFNPLMDESDKSVLLGRESTDDIYFRHISDEMFRKLQTEAYEEGSSFTKVVENEINSGNRSLAKEMDYLGWKVNYYPITTQEAYPHLTQIVDLGSTDAKGDLQNMIQYDFVKRYTLKPHEDFDSVFTHIRERCWQILLAPVATAGLHFNLSTMVGCVLQTINDNACITIRSYKSKTNAQVIYRYISLLFLYENEVHVHLLNPRHCISRVDGRNGLQLEDKNSSKYGNEEVYWVPHGHSRFGWYKVGDRDYEIRFGGTILLRGYSLDAKILEHGELIVNWEKSIFKESPISVASNK